MKTQGATTITEGEKARIHYLRASGMSFDKICKEVGRSKKTVMKAAREGVDPVWIYKDWLGRKNGQEI